MSKCNFNKVGKQLMEITRRHECPPVNLLPVFRTPFPKKNYGVLLLDSLSEPQCNINIAVVE